MPLTIKTGASSKLPAALIAAKAPRTAMPTVDPIYPSARVEMSQLEAQLRKKRAGRDGLSAFSAAARASGESPPTTVAAVPVADGSTGGTAAASVAGATGATRFLVPTWTSPRRTPDPTKEKR